MENEEIFNLSEIKKAMEHEHGLMHGLRLIKNERDIRRSVYTKFVLDLRYGNGLSSDDFEKYQELKKEFGPEINYKCKKCGNVDF